VDLISLRKMIEIDLDFIFFSAGIFFSLPLFWVLLAQKRPTESVETVRIPTMVVLGSGGHTTEILRLSSALNSEVYQPRSYVIADSDVRSEEKLKLSISGNESIFYKKLRLSLLL